MGKRLCVVVVAVVIDWLIVFLRIFLVSGADFNKKSSIFLGKTCL